MSIAITDYYPNYTLNGANAEFDLADLTALTAAEVDIATDGGNLPELAFAFLEQFAGSYLTRSANGESLPSGQTLTKSPPSSGGNSTTVNQTYTVNTTSVLNYATTDQPA